MSAFVVDPAHIDYLVSAAILYGYQDLICYGEYARANQVDHHNATDVGARLLVENITSVRHRYPHVAPDELPGPIPTPSAIDYRFRFTLNVNPIQVLKAIRCYEYQSCEHAEWPTSDAKTFCDRLRHAAINKLPGMDDAAWEITHDCVPA